MYRPCGKSDFNINYQPQGAFYIYADVSPFTDDSMTLANELLYEASVAVTPGADFGQHRHHHHIRFAYTTSLDQLDAGVNKMRTFLS